jgi:zinc/manganese transport system ATP-binding protein
MTAAHPAAEPAAPTADALPVRAESLRIVLGGKTVLDDVTLTVRPGQFMAVLGPNGAGKSTLMRTVLGLVQPAGGRLTVLGATPAQARRRIGYLPQRHSLEAVRRIRALDVVALGLEGTRWGLPLPLTRRARDRHRHERARVHEVLEMVGAAEFAGRPLGELSGGQQQRVLIAQTLVDRPRLLILDEPLEGLDLPAQVSVAALLARISQQEGVPVLLVAHDVNPLLHHLSGVVYLGAGRALCGSVEEVITAPALSRLYGVAIDVLRSGDGRLVVVGQPEPVHHHGH